RYKTHVRILIRSLKSEFLCPECEGTRLSSSLSGIAIALEELFFWKHVPLCTIEELNNRLMKILKSGSKLVHFEKVQKILIDVIQTTETAINLGIGNLPINHKVKNLTAG